MRSKGLQITLNAMYPAGKFGVLLFRQMKNHQIHQKVFFRSPYCGRLRKLPKGENNPESGSIDAYEIGLTYIPFYIIQAHEFIHMQHFLETFEVSKKLYTLRNAKGQFPVAQERLGPDEFSNLCKKQERFFCPFSELPDEEKVGIDQKEWDSLLAVQDNFDQIIEEQKQKKQENLAVQWTKDCGVIYKGNVLVDPRFIPYGSALRINDYKSYKENLSVVQRESFGKVAEFSDHTFLEDFFATLCETVRLKNNCISKIEEAVVQLAVRILTFG